MTLHYAGRCALGAASILALGLGLTGTAEADEISGAVVADPNASLEYTAPSGVNNQIVASVSWNRNKTKLIYRLDDVIKIDNGNICVYPDSSDNTKVRCTVTPVADTDPYATLTVKLGDGNDKVWFENRTGQSQYFNKFVLGPGSDWLDSATRTEDGSEVLGQGGNDEITTGPGSLALGGGGNDEITVKGKNSAADGGKGNDDIWGSGGRQFLAGGDGNDRVWGGGGSDDIWGDQGNDKLWGQGGNDRIWGGPGNDSIWGGAGKDVLRGGPGKNTVKQ